MRRSPHAVRYYIDRNENGAEVRSVPVSLRRAEPKRAARAEAPASNPAAVARLVRSAVRRAPRRAR